MGILLWEHFYQETRAERDIFNVPLGREGGRLRRLCPFKHAHKKRQLPHRKK